MRLLVFKRVSHDRTQVKCDPTWVFFDSPQRFFFSNLVSFFSHQWNHYASAPPHSPQSDPSNTYPLLPPVSHSSEPRSATPFPWPLPTAKPHRLLWEGCRLILCNTRRVTWAPYLRVGLMRAERVSWKQCDTWPTFYLPRCMILALSRHCS